MDPSKKTVRVGWEKEEDADSYTLPSSGINARTVHMGIPTPQKLNKVIVKADIEIAEINSTVNATDVTVANNEDACLYTYYTGSISSCSDSSLPFPQSGVIDENSEKVGYPQGISIAQKIPLGNSLIGKSPGVRKNITFRIPIRSSKFFNKVSIDKETSKLVETGYWGMTTIAQSGRFIINVDIKEVKFC